MPPPSYRSCLAPCPSPLLSSSPACCLRRQVDLLGMDHDEEARQHLYEEIRVLQKLKHKNIMT